MTPQLNQEETKNEPTKQQQQQQSILDRHHNQSEPSPASRYTDLRAGRPGCLVPYLCATGVARAIRGPRVKPAKTNTRTQRWDSLSADQQNNIRQVQEREALAEHTLVRLGAFWGCACGCVYSSTAGKSQRIAESAHAGHISAVKARREDVHYGNTTDYA